VTTTTTNSGEAAESARRELESRAGGDPPAPKHGGARPGSGRKKKGAARSKPKADAAEPISEEEVQAFALLGGTIWDLSANVFKMEKLDDEERARLGAAMAPVARKYLPSMDAYAPEVTLGIVLTGLVMSKRKKKPKTDEADLELENHNGAGEQAA